MSHLRIYLVSCCWCLGASRCLCSTKSCKREKYVVNVRSLLLSRITPRGAAGPFLASPPPHSAAAEATACSWGPAESPPELAERKRPAKIWEEKVNLCDFPFKKKKEKAEVVYRNPSLPHMYAMSPPVRSGASSSATQSSWRTKATVVRGFDREEEASFRIRLRTWNNNLVL